MRAERVEVWMEPWRRGAFLLGAVLAASCTAAGDEPVPPPEGPEPPAAVAPAGIRVGLVLPAAASEEDDQRAQVAADLQLVGGLRDSGISRVRTLEADGPEFLEDLATFLVVDGSDLVCAFGPDAQRVTAPLAARHPHLRFCAIPAGSSEPPDNLAAVEMRFEELGHLVGLAAARSAGDGPVASILGSDRAGVTRLRDGIRVGIDGVPLLESAPDDEDGVLAAVAAAGDAGADVLIIDVGTGAAAGVEAAVAAGMRVIGPGAVLAEVDAAEATILSWRLRWDVPLRPVVAAMLDTEIEPPTSVGLAENAFVVSLGGALEGRGVDTVEGAASELRRGVRDPLAPPPAATPAPEGD